MYLRKLAGDSWRFSDVVSESGLGGTDGTDTGEVGGRGRSLDPHIQGSYCYDKLDGGTERKGEGRDGVERERERKMTI